MKRSKRELKRHKANHTHELDPLCFGVILKFDKNSSNRISEIQSSLTEVEDEDQFQIYDIFYGVGPHITFALYDDVELPVIVDAIQNTFQNTTQIPINFASIALFPGSVLYLAPCVTIELLKLHNLFHKNAASLTRTCNSHYLPGAWIPHCSLGVPLPVNELSDAMMEIGFSWKPVQGHLISVELVSYPPAKSLHLQCLQ